MVMVTKLGKFNKPVDDYEFFHSLHQDTNFPFVSYRFPPKELKAKESLEDEIYREEYKWYSFFKDMSYANNTYMFHTSTLNKIIDRCHELLTC